MPTITELHLQRPRGRVALVGAGPGRPDLLTLRAAELLRAADVVFFDNLVAPEVVELAERARRVDVGKIGGGRAASQDVIDLMLRRSASRVPLTVRLKGGDPFVFGRGGEEAAALRGAGIDVEVVPGVSSAIAAAAAAGIPVTHRGVSTHFSVVTCTGAAGAPLDQTWVALARAGGTVVFMMGARRLAEVSTALVAGGVPASRPAAVVSAATTAAQEVVTGTLDDIAVRAAGLPQPATLVVGDVVALRSTLAGVVPAGGTNLSLGVGALAALAG
ncbi:MAG: uroporphyrinogen-III C-methyltransferase [Myxococcales bacterium]|nr:uroporphyrinogen-III C-methyltransferase [Myxococcales bacterium]MCB9530210.1 uroporphyrinogen-III C-methyltransferase [Myxococcales bacterium]MCB9533723.1 uroporphyrinogen-III C-methyltransferase [Myxococcales bacterium]